MSEHIVTGTDDNFAAEVLQNQGTVLVDFWAPWCGPCRMVAPVLEELAGEQSGKLKIVKINVDENRVAEQYRVMSIPTMALFQNGQLVKTVVGFKPKDALKREFGL